jgi:hypothetical protein
MGAESRKGGGTMRRHESYAQSILGSRKVFAFDGGLSFWRRSQSFGVAAAPVCNKVRQTG